MRRLSHSSVFKANFAIDERPKYPIHPYMYALSFLRSQFLELTQAFVTELLVRPISHDRLPVSLSLNPESKTKGFDIGGADWANLRLVLVDLQEQLSALRLRCSTNSPIPLRFVDRPKQR